jgi:thiamine biosynthesis lipoprotein ApbE
LGEKNHILASGQNDNPKNSFLSTSVISQNGAEADMWATILLSESDREIKKIIKEFSLKTILIKKDGEVILKN